MRTGRRRAARILVAAGVIAALAATARARRPAGEDPGGTGFATIAEGYSAAVAADPLEAAPRLFSAPDDVCREVAAVASLEVSGPETLAAGQPLPPSALSVTARDADGALVPRVPLTIELDAAAIDALDRVRWQESAEWVFGAEVVAELRFRTLCQSPPAAAGWRLRVE